MSDNMTVAFMCLHVCELMCDPRGSLVRPQVVTNVRSEHVNLVTVVFVFSFQLAGWSLGLCKLVGSPHLLGKFVS